MSYIARSKTMGEIETNIKLYDKMNMAYLGNGDYADGSILTKHARETAEGYNKRKDSVSYANYLKPLIDVGINAIFSREPARDYPANPQFEAFLKNVDGRHDMTKFMRKAATIAKKLGSTWLFMDNSPEPAATIEEAVRDRNLPYMFTVEPQMIKNFQLDYLGNLQSVSYFEMHINDLYEEIYYTVEWTCDTIIKYDNNGGKIFEAANSVGVIPCIVFISSEQELEEGSVPFPEYTNIRQLNTKIVNVDSLITNGLYQQGFSILTLCGPFDDMMEIGENSAINYDKDGSGTINSPAFIAPDAAPIEKMMEYIELLKQQIQEQSITQISSTKSENQSGTAKRIDNMDRSESLENQSIYIELIEKKIAQLFGLYIGKEIDYNVEYYKDFDIDDVLTSLKEAHSALEIEWSSSEVPKAIKLKQIKNIFGDGDLDLLDKLLDAEEKAVAPMAEAMTVLDSAENVVKTTEDHIDPVDSTTDSTTDKEIPINTNTDEIKTLILELKTAMNNQAQAIADAKNVKEVSEKAAQEITINNNNEMANEAKHEADLGNIKSLIAKVLYDLTTGVIDEKAALVIIRSYGFDDEKAKMILSKTKR